MHLHSTLDMGGLDRLPIQPVNLHELDHWIPYQCSIVANRVSLMLKRMYSEELGIGVTEWRLLANLAAHAPLSAKELAEHTAMDQVAVTRGISLLVRKKLVTRREDSVDRRKVVLRLTKAGTEAHAAVMPLVRAIETELTRGMPRDKLLQLRELLGALVQAAHETLGDDRDWRELADHRSKKTA